MQETETGRSCDSGFLPLLGLRKYRYEVHTIFWVSTRPTKELFLLPLPRFILDTTGNILRLKDRRGQLGIRLQLTRTLGPPSHYEIACRK